jgi:hypothetical protein
VLVHVHVDVLRLPATRISAPAPVLAHQRVDERLEAGVDVGAQVDAQRAPPAALEHLQSPSACASRRVAKL